MTEKVLPKSPSLRQAERNQRIKNAGLVQRKIVGHKDDFDLIRNYAKKLYKKRGINF